MPNIPITQVLLSIDKPLQDELITDSGLKLYIDPSYNKEWQSSVTATILALPANPNPKDKNVLSQVKVGDEVAISYDVVADFEFKGDGGQYMPMTEDNPHIKEFVNGRGEMVKVYALKKRAGLEGIIWVGIHQDNRRELIDGVQGSEEELGRWLSQFPFGSTDIYSFRNFFEYKKTDYWKCSPEQIYAKKVKGHLVSVGDRVICKPITEEIPDSSIINNLGGAKVKIVHQDRGRVVSGGKGKGIKKEDVISFDPRHLEKYEFWGKKYFLINERLILGNWN